MLSVFALVPLIASAKLFLIPLAILAFLLVLLLMGAFGLGVALMVISAFGWLFHLPARRRARRLLRRSSQP